MNPTAAQRRRLRCRFEAETPLAALAAAWAIVDEVSLFLATPLPRRFVAKLTMRAHASFARSPAFRRSLDLPGEAPRDRLYTCMRQWLAASLRRERPGMFRRLPRDFALGTELPAPPVQNATSSSVETLSNEARLLLAI